MHLEGGFTRAIIHAPTVPSPSFHPPRMAIGGAHGRCEPLERTRERSRERDDALIDSVRLRSDAHGFETERPGLFLSALAAHRWSVEAASGFRSSTETSS